MNDEGQLFRRILEDHPAPTLAVDGDGKVTAWNKAMATLTGHDAEDVLGNKSWRGFHVRRRPTPVDDALRAGESLTGEIEFEDGDGNTQHRTVRVQVSLDENGEPRGAVAVLEEAGIEAG